MNHTSEEMMAIAKPNCLICVPLIKPWIGIVIKYAEDDYDEAIFYPNPDQVRISSGTRIVSRLLSEADSDEIKSDCQKAGSNKVLSVDTDCSTIAILSWDEWVDYMKKPA